ncbi:hypothetical protein [Paraburkholderia humisilvae]|uniref:hypothetical protein n=1 Tax=Paraburkholderia humisilvae TaxID=627669 RepID=UPI0015842F47|nr:hypothetical protein [Paraburkholderia humisilvae]
MADTSRSYRATTKSSPVESMTSGTTNIENGHMQEFLKLRFLICVTSVFLIFSPSFHALAKSPFSSVDHENIPIDSKECSIALSSRDGVSKKSATTLQFLFGI